MFFRLHDPFPKLKGIFHIGTIKNFELMNLPEEIHSNEDY